MRAGAWGISSGASMDVSMSMWGETLAPVGSGRALWVLLALVSSGCLGEGAVAPRGELQVSVAPLQLDGITDAQYTIVVTNAADGLGDVVWSRTVTSDRYGDGSGEITYIGPCDASAGTHTVTLTLDWLRDGDGLVEATSYVNPTPVSLEPSCVENTDVPVRFDITLMRSADQGFFDVSVQFEDIFCSAKLDCQKPDGSDLDLLFNGANRDMTAVLGLACAGGPTGETYLYMDDLVIDCAGATLDVRVEPTGLGLVTPTSNPNGYLFGAGIYRGVEASGVMYWNATLGLDSSKFAQMGVCTLRARATASSTPWPQLPAGFPLPEATVYPVIEWDVRLSDAGGRVCTQHEVNGGNGVATDYLGYLPLTNGFTWANEALYMRHRLEEAPAGTLVLSAGAPICNPSCAHGGCVDRGAGPVCDCAGTGYTGPTCATPVCTSPCQNGGACVAPNTCDCAGTGFGGSTCETDLDECATANGGCSADATCTNTVGGLTCECDPGFYGDGVTCTACPAGEVQPLSGQASCNTCPAGTWDDGDETCATCGTCNPGQRVTSACSATANTVCGLCPAGTFGDGLTCTACPAGQVQPDAGSASCNTCPAGSWDDGDETCATCGTCNPGQRVTSACGVTTNTVCGLCPAGTFGDGLTCTACPAGQVQPDAGSASCTTCPAGSYDDGDETCATCGTCSAGTWETGACTATTNRTCGACTAVSMCVGSVTCTSASNSVCSQCAAGYQQLSAGAACTDIDECATNNGGCGPTRACTNTAGGFSCSCPAGTFDYDGDNDCETAANCYDILAGWSSAPSGPYTVDPDGQGVGAAFQVYCDMTTDGGGWTLVLNQTTTTFHHLKSLTAELASLSTAGGHNKVATLIPAATEIRYTDASGTRFLQAYLSGSAYWNAMSISGDSSPVAVAYIDGPLSGVMRSIEVRDIFHWGHRHNVPTVDGVTTSVTDYDSRSCLHTCWEDVDPNVKDRAFAGDHCNSATTPSFCPGAAGSYAFPATSTRGGSFNYRKWVRSRPPASCLEWRALGYTGSTTYTIDPDGLGPIAPFSAFCDMSWDGGGWTLVRSTLATDCLGTSGPVAQGTARYLPTATLLALANRSAQVHIRTRDLAATRSATSVRHTLAIQNLRVPRTLNIGMPMSAPPTATTENWFGPMVPAYTWYNCAASNSPWPTIYHACNNGDGLHLTQSQCRWDFTDPSDENMEIYVR